MKGLGLSLLLAALAVPGATHGRFLPGAHDRWPLRESPQDLAPPHGDSRLVAQAGAIAPETAEKSTSSHAPGGCTPVQIAEMINNPLGVPVAVQRAEHHHMVLRRARRPRQTACQRPKLDADPAGPVDAGLDSIAYGPHSMRRTKPTLIYRRTKSLRPVQLLLGHSKPESTVRYLGIDVDDAVAIAEQTEV